MTKTKSGSTDPPVITNEVAKITLCFRLQSSKSQNTNPILGCFPLLPVNH